MDGAKERSGEAWRVGVLFSQSGVTAAIETTQLNATRLAIDEVNQTAGLLDRELVPIVYDPASSPQVYRRQAERLLDEDEVRVILGCYMSSTRKAVLPAVETRGGLLFYPTLYEGFEFSPNCIYTGAAPNQNSVLLAKYMLENFGNRVLFVGSNYIYPYESNRIMGDLIKQYGGKILDELYVPLGAQVEDFQRALRSIGEHRPDFVFSTVVGSGTAVFYEACRKAGFEAREMPIASLTTSEAEVAEMSSEAAEGHFTAATFFEVAETPAGRAFVQAYKQRYGEDAPVTHCAEAAYFQIHLLARALAEAGTDRPAVLLEALRGREYDAPQGRVLIDPDNHHTHLWPKVARLDSARRFEVVWDPDTRLRPDPYFIAPSLDDWAMEGALAAGS